MTKILAYHFTGSALRNGGALPKRGTWLKFAGPIRICNSGLHASRDPFDALQYAPGPLLHLVEVRNIVVEQSDKFVCRERKIIKTINSDILNWEIARWSALQVIHLWKAPQIVVDYLTTGNKSLRAAAWAATRDAEWDAARAAAWDAARAAEWAVARDAEWAAARDAEWDAAGVAARAAAGAAARAAAWAAIRDAEWDAAWSAEWAVECDAAKDKQRKQYKILVDQYFD